MRVFLIHGMGRTPRSLALLAWRLERAGMTVHSFGYRVREHELRHIAARFAAFVAEHAHGPYAIVGHSLGNVIARLASPALAPGFARFVMLAPPNRPARLATLLRDRVVFRALTSDAGQRLADPAFYDALPVPSVPTLIFAGTAGPRASWLPHGSAASDGIVAVEETHYPGADHREVAAIHTFIMNDAEVTKAIVEFLRPAEDRTAPA
jgi:alpha-beta hydrolase superfamily lysophospholipase